MRPLPHSPTSPRIRLAAWLLALLVAWLLAPHGSAEAGDEDEVRAAFTYFQEPAPNTPLIVFHPQVLYSQDYTPNFGLALGYDADVVTGATPQIFGVDATTSATSFKDTRHNGTLGLRFMGEKASLRVGGGFAGEKDYLSGTVSVGSTADLFNRNTQVSLDYSHNFDRVCDAANAATQNLLELRALDSSVDCFKDSAQTTTRKLSIDSVQLAVTQVLTPWALMQVGVSGQHLRGFQSNPYRQVLLGRRAVQERVPGIRNRGALFARAKFALKPIRGSIDLMARLYADSWAIEAFTGEAAWNQYLARPLILRLRARWHIQDSALFYRDGNEYASGGAAGSYWTGDRELSALMNTTLGAKLTYLWRTRMGSRLKRVDGISLSAKADLLFYRSRTPNPGFSPNAERTQGLLDAVVIQAQAGLTF